MTDASEKAVMAAEAETSVAVAESKEMQEIAINDLPIEHLDDPEAKEKPHFGKRDQKTAIIHLLIWLAITAYIIPLMILGKGKYGYEFVILLWVFVSLRLLAQHVSMSYYVYTPLGKAFDATFGRIQRAIPEKFQIPALAVVLVVFMLAASLGSPTTNIGSIPQRIQSLIGLCFLLGILYATSIDRSAIKWRTVVVGLLLQYILALIILRTQFGVNVFKFISKVITLFLGESYQGFAFLFGDLAADKYLKGLTFTFAVSVLPAIVFFCSFISIVYYLGGMQYIVAKFAWVMVRLMDTSGAESVVAAASPFVGQGESALMVRPFVEYMTQAELHSTMTSGFSTIAGSVLLAYIKYTGYSDAATSALLAACVLSVPCSLLVSKMRFPEKEDSLTRGNVRIPKSEEEDANFLHAAGNGAATGVQLILLISGALLSIVTLYTIADFIVGFLFDMINVHNEIDGGAWVTIKFVLSYVFTPIAIAIGIPPHDARKAAEFMATKMVANEFVAYANLNGYAYGNVSSADGTFPSNGAFDDRTLRLLAFALCGFANFASIGIQIGCLGAMAPSRKKDLAQLALSAMLCGTFSTWITAAVAGSLL
ncbi:hypothetical protein HK101_011682 [Irineochytrium annulatum]|nr:hypothetical protein HK101_011682 [Irineochytrium annulatum]